MDSLPKRIYVSGMPLMLRGWNGLYRATETPCMPPEWHLDSHNYYGIWIIHTKITQESGRWVLKVADGYEQIIVYGPLVSDSSTPLGEWGDIYVDVKQSARTWWRSNSSLTYTACVLSTLFSIFYFIIN